MLHILGSSICIGAEAGRAGAPFYEPQTPVCLKHPKPSACKRQWAWPPMVPHCQQSRSRSEVASEERCACGGEHFQSLMLTKHSVSAKSIHGHSRAAYPQC